MFSLILSIAYFITKASVFNSVSNNEWKKYSSEYIIDHLNDTIVYPDSIKSEFNDSVTFQDIKILFAVDMDCSACKIKFAFWNEFCNKMLSKYGIKVPIKAYISGIETSIYERVKKEWNRSWAYDKYEEFVTKNNLFDDRFQSVLIDDKNIIKLIGNPMHNPELANLYEKTILNYFKNR